jgi:hypothetical protein
MGLEDGYCVNLIEDLKDGLMLLRVIEHMRKGSVQWDKAYKTKRDNRIYRIQNCNYAIELIAKSFDCKIVGIGGIDIVDGRVIADLGIIWQLYRLEALSLIGNKTEEQLLSWANGRVPEGVRVKGLKDKALEDSQFWFALIDSIDKEVVDRSVIKTREEPAGLDFNAKYALASARKAGAQVIILWEHIREVNGKMLLIFLASLYLIAQKRG